MNQEVPIIEDGEKTKTLRYLVCGALSLSILSSDFNSWKISFVDDESKIFPLFAILWVREGDISNILRHTRVNFLFLSYFTSMLESNAIIEMINFISSYLNITVKWHYWNAYLYVDSPEYHSQMTLLKCLSLCQLTWMLQLHLTFFCSHDLVVPQPQDPCSPLAPGK